MKSFLVLFALVAVCAAQNSEARRRPPFGGGGGGFGGGRDSHDSRDSRDSHDSRPRPPRPGRDSDENPPFRPNPVNSNSGFQFPNRDSRDSRNSQNSRDSRDSRPSAPSRDSRDSRNSNEFIAPAAAPGLPQTRAFSFNGRNSLSCGLSCSTSATFTTNIDGTSTTARCTDPNANAGERCPGCCTSVALAAGLGGDRAAGFPSNNGRACVCCIRAC